LSSSILYFTASSSSALATYTNPVHGAYFADPFVWRCGADCFAIGTGAAEASGNATAHTKVFPLLRSRNLVDWQPAGHALQRPDPAFGNSFWAPEVAESNGRWYLYYSVGHDDRHHQLRVAISREPLGPYVDSGALTSLVDSPFAIDPHPFRDCDGRWYLFHARDFLTTDGADRRAVRVGTGLVVAALIDMTSLAPEVRIVARARHDWQRFARDRIMYGGVYDWHTLEGPCVVRCDDRYYCLYSGGCWQTDSYGVDYVVADSIFGPWSDDGAEFGPRVLRSEPQSMLGPGHCSVVDCAESGRRYLAYHAWDPRMTARRLCIDDLFITPDGPRSPGPSSAPRPLPLLRAEQT
jgi:beta-xylosidase